MKSTSKRPLSARAKLARQRNGKRAHENLRTRPINELGTMETKLRQPSFSDPEEKRRFKEYLRG